MSTLEKAIEVAARAHAGQSDKAGEPYIFHPIRVMLAQSDPRARIAAILHDVVEDSDVTLDDLRREGFSEEVVVAVDALTEREGETRLDKAKRAAKNEIALRVKLADVTDNMDMSRIPRPAERDHARLREYQQMMEILLAKAAWLLST